MMTFTEAKTILKGVKNANSYDEMRDIYAQYNFPSDGISPWYNKFTSHKQKWDIEDMKVGEKTGLYFSKGQVSTWTGKKIGKIKSLSYYTSYGFAVSERVYIVFEYKGMRFHGICSEIMKTYRVYYGSYPLDTYATVQAKSIENAKTVFRQKFGFNGLKIQKVVEV